MRPADESALSMRSLCSLCLIASAVIGVNSDLFQISSFGFRISGSAQFQVSGFTLRSSDFGTRPSFGLRVSAFGLQIYPTALPSPRLRRRRGGSRRASFGSYHAGQIRRSKAETRKPKPEPPSAAGFGLRISELGLLSAFGFRPSTFKSTPPLSPLTSLPPALFRPLDGRPGATGRHSTQQNGRPLLPRRRVWPGGRWPRRSTYG